MWREGARGGFDQAAAQERVASGRRAPYLPCALLVVSRWCLEGSGKERRRVGDHLDAAPRSGLARPGHDRQAGSVLLTSGQQKGQSQITASAAPQRVWLSRLPGTRDRKMLCETYLLRFDILAGLPNTVTLGGTSRVTTLPAPTMASSPILTPGRMIVPPPIQTFRPMRTGMPCS